MINDLEKISKVKGKTIKTAIQYFEKKSDYEFYLTTEITFSNNQMLFLNDKSSFPYQFKVVNSDRVISREGLVGKHIPINGKVIETAIQITEGNRGEFSDAHLIFNDATVCSIALWGDGIENDETVFYISQFDEWLECTIDFNLNVYEVEVLEEKKDNITLSIELNDESIFRVEVSREKNDNLHVISIKNEVERDIYGVIPGSNKINVLKELVENELNSSSYFKTEILG
ncbi:hypothetical protein J0K78_10545 [Halobacillus sp. GSS1]|uniref:hypothetical protein n=1 Tax=Halobacillus sp. GSS1 TaxID=2815919 RepID=UPI001A8C4DAD|nr:hypothetical protein [Halobacillus sp. GSS1]MBN9654702.1 hypothetical protein [Halobacillus sp. GSS1]